MEASVVCWVYKQTGQIITGLSVPALYSRWVSVSSMRVLLYAHAGKPANDHSLDVAGAAGATGATG
jgi:hypothetical protein